MIAFLGLLAVLISGCDDTVHVFQPEEKPLPSVLAEHPAQQSMITVAPVEGLPEPLSHDLARAMVKALEKRSLPVVLRDHADASALYSVSGRFQPASEGKGRLPGGPVLTWEVRDQEGQLVGRHSQIMAAGTNPLSAATRSRLFKDVDGEPAVMMVKGIEGDAPVPSETSAPAASHETPAASRSLAVTKIEGAPGKGGDVPLRRAIEYALTVANVHVIPTKTAGSLTLACAIALSDMQDGVKHIAVTWTVYRPDGKELGQVSQENNVPSRLIETVWGEIASAVAQAGAGGIAALVQEADRPAPAN